MFESLFVGRMGRFVINRPCVRSILARPKGVAVFTHHMANSNLNASKASYHITSGITNQRSFTSSGRDCGGGNRVIATPIFYVNGAPHIGHFYSAVMADAFHRWVKMSRADVTDDLVFSTGTDEHGLKVYQAASAANMEPQEFCNMNSSKFLHLCEAASIEFTDFVRTSDSRHRVVVEQLWALLHSKGQIYKGSYEGWYCISDEEFLSDGQVTEVERPDGSTVMISTASGNEVVRMTESNYMFRLSEYGERITAWLDENPDLIQPPNRAKAVRQFLKEGLPDLSVSRLATTVKWGIPVPGDAEHIIYVWLDALANYLTAGGYPNYATVDTHIIGKDILKFHAIYWPAFLMAAELPLPKQIVAHGHWTVNKGKMAKSKGNVVDPHELMERFGVDQCRYFILSEGRNQGDADFSESKIASVVSEFANNLGNLLSRCVAKKVNLDMRVPFRAEIEQYLTDEEEAIITNANTLYDKVKPEYDVAQFGKGIAHIQEFLTLVNRYIDAKKPWVLAKTPDDQLKRQELRTTLYVCLEALRIAGVLLQPVCPEISTELLDHLGATDRLICNAKFGLLDGQPLTPRKQPLVKKVTART